MKIPTYKRQTAFPAQAGAQFLGVQASPGAFGAPGAAMQQIGQTIQTEAARWGQIAKQELETERTATLAANLNGLEEKIRSTEESNTASDVSTWTDPNSPQLTVSMPGVPEGVALTDQQIQPYSIRRQAVQRGLQDYITTQASQISDKAVRQRYIAAANKRVFEVMPGLSKTLRARYNDYAESQLDLAILNKIQTAARQSSGAINEQTMTDIDGLIEWWGSWGGHKRADIEKRKRDARSDIDGYKVGLQLSQAANENNERGEERVEAVIKGLELGAEEYANLDTNDRRYWVDKAYRELQNIRNNIDAQEEAAVRGERKALDDRQASNYDTISRGIDETRNQLAAGQSPDVPMSNWLKQIDDKRQARQLNEGGADALRERASGKKGVVNWDRYHQHIEDIDDAVTDDDLDFKSEQLAKERATGLIGEKAHAELTTMISDMRDDTPEYQERTAYRADISRILGRAQTDMGQALMESMLAVNLPDSARIDAATALRFFEEQVAGGVRPAEAYFDTLQRFLMVDSRKMLGAGIVKASRLTRPDGNSVFALQPGDEVDKDNIGEFVTRKTLAAAREALSRHAKGKDLPIEALQYSGDPDAPLIVGLTQEQAAEEQRKRRLSKDQRVTLRALVKMENELEFLESLLPLLGPSDNQSEGKVDLQQEQISPTSIQVTIPSSAGAGGEDKNADDGESATEAAKNRGGGVSQ